MKGVTTEPSAFTFNDPVSAGAVGPGTGDDGTIGAAASTGDEATPPSKTIRPPVRRLIVPELVVTPVISVWSFRTDSASVLSRFPMMLVGPLKLARLSF